MIISVSRRCDIPRFQFDWFMERLEAGFTDVTNPFNRGQVRRVSLLPGDADAFVFWTRDPRPILLRAAELEERGIRYYVMTTLTGYPAVLEPDVPAAEEVIAAMEGLAEKLGPERVVWRYDPIILSSCTDEAFHSRNFRALAEALGASVCRVIVSLYDPYPAAERRLFRLEKTGTLGMMPLYGADGSLLPRTRELLADLAGIARETGMEIRSCAEGAEFLSLGIEPGACIDGERIRRLWGIEAGGRDTNQRPLCRCAPATDIGRYGPCPAGCAYCYARR
ncbi:MAG: DUF1848 domain-containing protein [Spirochaetaceae bacterium]|jgi:hypothetical protein|nr:DUF1848 domain-containing protein [Spirochaetaceae bacterium]